MIFRKSLVSMGALLLSLTASAEMAERVVGVNETVLLTDLELTLPAKLDTGAMTSSLSAQNIETFQREGEEWVRFELAVDGEHDGRELEKAVVRTVNIRRRAEDVTEGDQYASRPVVKMELCLGEESRVVEVNLTDRSAFNYPLLIGTTALKAFDAMVDPALSNEAGVPSCS